MNAIEKLDETRERLPEAIAGIARVVVDNPGQTAVLLSGAIVMDKILINLVKPRGLVEKLALMVVAPVLAGILTGKVMKAGYLEFYERDEEGDRVPMELKGADAEHSQD